MKIIQAENREEKYAAEKCKPEKTADGAVYRLGDRTPDGKLLYGGDYNPDQWLDRPDILEEDIRYMKEAQVNCASIGIFSWSALEPEEGVYRLEWLEKVIDYLYENGIYTVLATPSGAFPAWMSQKYEEIRQVNSVGQRRLYGSRHNFCLTSPVMREKTRAIDTVLAKRFGTHPGVILWHISNEMGNNGTDSACHCELCQNAFRGWLKKKYQTLDRLNKVWWTSFWSHTYTDWEQIHSPSPIGEHEMHGLKLDWKRFVNDQLLDFCKEEIAAVKSYSDRPVTTNMMAFFPHLNYTKWADAMDIISWDNYPYWHSEPDEIGQAAEIAAQHSFFRSLKNQPYLMMESVPSSVNWRPKNILKRPGMNELSSMQAIAHGCNSVQYFQWRQSRGSCEKFHGAVVGHLNGDNTRVFRDVTKLGERLEDVSSLVADSCNRAKVAVLFDAENRWAITDAWAVDNELDYYKLFLKYYRPLWEKGIDADVIDMEGDLSSYQLVIAPYNYLYRDGYVEKVEKFIRQGGIYVTTCWSGEADENDLCFLDEHPLRRVLGIRTEEYDVPNEYWKNAVIYQEKTYPVTEICALVHAESAQVLAEYEDDFYAGRPALTVNSYGAGKAYYIAAESTEEFLNVLYDRFLADANVHCVLDARLPYGVTVSERICRDGKSLLFVQNFNREAVELTLNRSYQDAESGNVLEGVWRLEAFSCRILQEC